MAASTYAELSAFAGMASLDVGAWDVPADMVAQIHRGEMVVPANFAAGMCGEAAGSGGGGQQPMVINITTNASMVDGTSFATLVNRCAGTLAATVSRQFSANPSLRAAS